MDNNLTVVKTIGAVCNTARSIGEAIRLFGYFSKEQKEILMIQIEKAKRACISNAVYDLFALNLDLLEKATEKLNSKKFTGEAKTAAEQQYKIFERNLEDNLTDFYRHFPNR